ncbi:MAG TPA: AAA family ATPase, partial [Bacteroidales bacterium]|nr:AAA family ATPase [Bacteroidales bacterium]
NQENFRKELSVDQAIRMTDGIMQVMSDNSLEVNEKNIIAAKIKSRYFNKCLINIVEEPEQNLYPSSQRKMLNSLLEFNNNIEGNKLIMTTHSPYLINYLTLAVKTYSIKEKLKDENIKIKLQEITPLSSVIKPDDLIVYELNEEFGGIKRLETYNGLPSDENLLNERLGETNELFGQLLDIEQSL